MKLPCTLGLALSCLLSFPRPQADASTTPTDPDNPFSALLDAPILFVKRHSYTGIHIYDTYYKWPPGGGGIYILENPSAPRPLWRIRPLIDPDTPESCGFGLYTHPELSWDAQQVLFCFKDKPDGNTSIFQIGIDGKNLRRLTDPSPTCVSYNGSQNGQHDIAPAYLPDGRIVFLSTRQSGLVPCNNTGVAILHVMNHDGTDIHPISVNYVNEFDPAVLPDGRILYGRWEYVDKNALTIQSLWTCNPDGTQETALYANNMVFPEAILDARPVPDSPWLAGTLAKHNGPPRGSIAFLDPRAGKNNPAALINLEHPHRPTHDLGDSCEPWPLDDNIILFSGRPPGAQRNALQLIDRAGHRVTLLADPDICLHSPMLVKPRTIPPLIPTSTDRNATTGRFIVQDVSQGLPGIKRSEVKWLRVIEETSRVSASTMGGSPYNQTFLVSAALAFSTKNYLGLAPVNPDGSAHFEAPSGRALYFQALDGDRRLIQSMRTFIQAAPGTVRSCIGCHEDKSSAPPHLSPSELLLTHPPTRLQPESWGSGPIDYPSMIQPILNQHCARCHGGPQGIAAGLDLTGGWTEHFNISYENLVSRRESQLEASQIAGIDCMNGTAFWSSQIFPPRSHGSGAAPLAHLLLQEHHGVTLGRAERDLLLAWIDSNGLYHGTWDSTPSGCATRGWQETRAALIQEMERASCLRCHRQGNATRFEEDWINLEQPDLSRILRAPLPVGADGFGLGWCRDRSVPQNPRRIRQLVNGYAHAVQPIEAFTRSRLPLPDHSGSPVVSFPSTQSVHYQSMLAILRTGQKLALANPRVDMPGAKIIPGESRHLIPVSLPDRLPALHASLTPSGVRLSWDRRSDLAGLTFEIHRGTQPTFTPDAATHLVSLSRSDYLDPTLPAHDAHYALVCVINSQRTIPVRASISANPTPPKRKSSSSATPADVISSDASHFTTLLCSPLAEQRIEGIQGLSNLKHWPAETTLLRSLNDPTPAVRLEAIQALARLGGPLAIPCLIAQLNDSSWEIRHQTALTLQSLTAQDFDTDQQAWQKWWADSPLDAKEQTLLQTVLHPPGSRSTAIPQASPAAFVPSAPGRRTRTRSAALPLAHPQRHDALRALVCLASASSENDLLQLLLKPQTPPLDPTERNLIFEALERIGSINAIPILAAHPSDSAAWALGSLGGPEAEKALLRFPKNLATLLALDRLHSTNAGAFVPHLVAQMGLITYRSQPDDVMNDDPQPIQRVAANLIQRSGMAPLLFECVLQQLEDTMQPPIPHRSRPNIPSDWDDMLKRMQSELKAGFVREDGTTTSQPVAALCYTATDPALVPRLIPLLKHPAIVVRVYVALTLGRLHAHEATPLLLDMIQEGYPFNDAVALASGKHFEHSQTIRWRGFLCLALGRMGGAEARSALEALSIDPAQPRDIRYGAVVGLGFINCPNSLPTLRRVADADIIWLVRDQATQAAQKIQSTLNPPAHDPDP